MATLDLPKAIRSNLIFATCTKPPWKGRFAQVARQLGFVNQTPSAEAFAKAVHQWQKSQPGLSPDGMLGPVSWAKLEPATRYTLDVGGPPEWLEAPPPGGPPAPPALNGVTDFLDVAIRTDPGYETQLLNMGQLVGSIVLGQLHQSSKLARYGAGAVIQPLIWAYQGNTGDDADKLLYALGLIPPLSLAAGVVGVWKGRLDDDVIAKMAQVTADEPARYAKAIYPAGIFRWAGPEMNAMTIAGRGGVAWQHPNGLWVYLKLEQAGREVLVCDYKPKRALKVFAPDLPLRMAGGRYFWRSQNGKY